MEDVGETTYTWIIKKRRLIPEGISIITWSKLHSCVGFDGHLFNLLCYGFNEVAPKYNRNTFPPLAPNARLEYQKLPGASARNWLGFRRKELSQLKLILEIKIAAVISTFERINGTFLIIELFVPNNISGANYCLPETIVCGHVNIGHV